MKRTPAIAVATLIAALSIGAACSDPLRSLIGLAPPPPIVGRVPPFHLVSDDGKPFDSVSLAGRPWLASFLYTSCPGPCPRLVERLKTLRRSIPVARLGLVSISVDPATDTPKVLAAYKASKGITANDGWVFVTGPADAVTDLVQHGFVTGLERGGDSKDGGTVTHGVRVALVDAQGRIRDFYSTDSDDELARLVRDVASLD